MLHLFNVTRAFFTRWQIDKHTDCFDTKSLCAYSNGGEMRNVQQLLDGKPHRLVTIAPTASVLDALKLMAEKEIGALVVLDGEKLVGIFSERDYARKIILFGKSSHDTAVSEIMTPQVVSVRPTQTADECMALMTGRRVRHLPVLSDNKVIGLISIGDVVKEMLDDQQRTIEQLEQYIRS